LALVFWEVANAVSMRSKQARIWCMMSLLGCPNIVDWPNIVGWKVSWVKVVLGHLHGAGEPAGSTVCWVLYWRPGVLARGEKIPSSGRAGGAELEGAAEAEYEYSKPISVRGCWDIVSSEGG
jgi:hypothetical protein